MRSLLVFIAVALSSFTTCSCRNATADVVLQVNVSDPSNVTVTATDAVSQGTFLDVDSFLGITLVGFLGGNLVEDFVNDILPAIEVFDSTMGTTRSPLDDWFVGVFDDQGLTAGDLNFYDGPGTFGMSFFDSAPALAGSYSIDLSMVTGALPPGLVGDVVVGNLPDNQVIGQWQTVVPEPTSTAFLGVCLIGSWMRRRRCVRRYRSIF